MVKPNSTESRERTAVAISEMSREQLTYELLNFKAKRVRLDFSREYLEGLPVEALRHLLWAALTRLTPAA
jgi:hypothetical protein